MYFQLSRQLQTFPAGNSWLCDLKKNVLEVEVCLLPLAVSRFGLLVPVLIGTLLGIWVVLLELALAAVLSWGALR